MRRAFVGLLLLAACTTSVGAPGSGPSAPPNALRIPVTIEGENGTVSIQAEVADTPATRTRGLMFRKSMADNEGMIFLFPKEDQLSFWMHNTLIPLDMVFIQSDHKILGVVENAAPQTDTSRRVPGLSQFVLEVVGGLSAKMGIKAGQTVTFYAPLPSN